jgi:hypothetical protein
MHTSRLTAILFVVAIAFAALAQVTNYCGTPIGQRTFLQKIALLTGIAAVVLSGIAGWWADTDWATLPGSPEGLSPGQLWDDGGIPAIVHEQRPNQ